MLLPDIGHAKNCPAVNAIQFRDSAVLLRLSRALLYTRVGPELAAGRFIR
jgi:hypothetical protein